MAKVKKVVAPEHRKGSHGRPIERGVRAGRAEKIALPVRNDKTFEKKLKASKNSKQIEDAGAFE
jgi:hypothetical protein